MRRLGEGGRIEVQVGLEVAFRARVELGVRLGVGIDLWLGWR